MIHFLFSKERFIGNKKEIIKYLQILN